MKVKTMAGSRRVSQARLLERRKLVGAAPSQKFAE